MEESMERAIRAGDKVGVSYTGRFEDGNVFESSEGRPPLEFTVGAGQVIPGFDRAVVGMSVGEKKTLTVLPEDAYGPYQTEYVVDLPKEIFPADMQLAPGIEVQLLDKAGRPMPYPAKIVEILDAGVRLDLNHELAGRTLVFDIEIVSAKQEEEA
jgi:peptidylprolyl isomerase